MKMSSRETLMLLAMALVVWTMSACGAPTQEEARSMDKESSFKADISPVTPKQESSISSNESGLSISLGNCKSSQKGKTKCDGAKIMKCKKIMSGVFMWREMSSCNNGCYTQDSAAYCKCSGGKTAGQSWCSGAAIETCQLSSSSGGTTSSSNCNNGCTTNTNQQPYCKCNGNRSAGATWCAADGSINTCGESNAADGLVTTSVTCSNGCYQSAGHFYCKCEGGRTAGTEWCTSGGEVKKCEASTQAAGSVTTRFTCNNGCYEKSGSYYCKCAGGGVDGQQRCVGSLSKICYPSTSPNGYEITLATCTYGCRMVSGIASCNCSEFLAGTGKCTTSSYINRCEPSHQSNGDLRKNPCYRGCVQNSAGTDATCRCYGGRTPGQSWCQNGDRHVCKWSSERDGLSEGTDCGTYQTLFGTENRVCRTSSHTYAYCANP